VLARGSKQTFGVGFRLHQCGSVHQSLRGVPYYITHRLLWVDPEQVLENGKERDFLRSVLHPVVDGVKDVKVGREVNVVGPVRLALVALLLLLEDVELDAQVRIFALGLDVSHDLKQLQANELVPQPIPLFQLGRRNDQTVDESKKNRPVFAGFRFSKFFNNNAESISA